jgi:hypothetical protein
MTEIEIDGVIPDVRREQAGTFEEALGALRWADKLCTLISVQTTRVSSTIPPPNPNTR